MAKQQNYYLPNNNVQSYNGIQQQYNRSQSNMNIPQNIQFNYNQSQPIGYTPWNNVPNNNYILPKPIGYIHENNIPKYNYNQPQPIGYIQGNNIPNNNQMYYSQNFNNSQSINISGNSQILKPDEQMIQKQQNLAASSPINIWII